NHHQQFDQRKTGMLPQPPLQSEAGAKHRRLANHFHKVLVGFDSNPCSTAYQPLCGAARRLNLGAFGHADRDTTKVALSICVVACDASGALTIRERGNMASFYEKT